MNKEVKENEMRVSETLERLSEPSNFTSYNTSVLRLYEVCDVEGFELSDFLFLLWKETLNV